MATEAMMDRGADCRRRAAWYSSVGFLRSGEEQLSNHFFAGLDRAVEAGHLAHHEWEGVGLWVGHLPWDSDYFGVPTHRLEFTDWPEGQAIPPSAVATAVRNLEQTLGACHSRHYLFAEVPSEDTVVLQGLGLAGFRLVETRLTYYRDDMDRFQWPRRAAVRPAVDADIPGIRETAAATRNTFDRFHADAFFSPALADAFIATFAENSVRGFADLVLVPADGGHHPGAFLTAKLLSEESALLGRRLGRMVLSAVSEAKSGWYLRLIAEMSYWMKDQGVQVAFMTTQATNRAVIRVWEKLGYRYGRCTHIFAFAADARGTPPDIACNTGR